MNMADLAHLLEYRVWARERVLKAVDRLPAADFTKETVSSFPSVRDTLVHVLSADVVWAARLDGRSPGAHLPAGEFPDLAALRARWVQADLDLRAAVIRNPARTVVYRTFNGAEYRQPLWQIVQHVVNHQTYHFGQVATMLRQLGAATVDVDLIVFDRTP